MTVIPRPGHDGALTGSPGGGFYVLSPSAEVEYKCTSVRDAADEIGIAWNDPRIGIRWPTTDPLLSDRDRGHAGLDGMADRLPEWTGRP